MTDTDIKALRELGLKGFWRSDLPISYSEIFSRALQRRRIRALRSLATDKENSRR